MNLDDMQRAERLYDNTPSPMTTPKDSFVMGYLASKRLTDTEWAEKREQVATAIADAEPGPPFRLRSEDGKGVFLHHADYVLPALGFTRTSEPGGDTC